MDSPKFFRQYFKSTSVFTKVFNKQSFLLYGCWFEQTVGNKCMGLYLWSMCDQKLYRQTVCLAMASIKVGRTWSLTNCETMLFLYQSYFASEICDLLNFSPTKFHHLPLCHTTCMWCISLWAGNYPPAKICNELTHLTTIISVMKKRN